MRVIITGGTGYLGTKLIEAIKDQYEVVALSRTPQKYSIGGAKVAGWDGKSAEGWGHLADGAFAIVNLAGTNIGATVWTKGRKESILHSRLSAGRAVVEAVRAAAVKPKVVLQQSGIGFYGSAQSPVGENAPAGDDFLANVCVQWEASTAEVESMGVRRVISRTAVVLDPTEGALQRLLIPIYLFVGGPLGSGDQPFPWIHPHDQIGAMRYALENEKMRGVYNFTAPERITNVQLVRLLGKLLGRPTFMPAPAFALKLALGELSMVVLEGQNAIADKLQESGYHFKFPAIEPALRDLLK